MRLLSTTEAAKVIGVCSKTLIAWYKAKKIKGIKTIGRNNKNAYLFDVAGFLEKNGIEPGKYLNKFSQGETENVGQKQGVSGNIQAKIAPDKVPRRKP